MNEPNVEAIEPATLPPEEQWSDRAQQRLQQARYLGLFMVLSGAISFGIGSTVSNVLSSYLANGGLTLLITGLVIIAATMRTHGLSPAQPFGPASIVNPRMWFILLWGAGIGLVVVLNTLEPAETTEQILMLLIATPLMVIGGLWILRWLGGQLKRQWPDSAVVLQWVPNWTVIWAGVWGLVSTIIAFVIEAAPILLIAILSGVSFNDVSRTPLSPYESYIRLLHNPVLLIIIFLGATIAAPIIEEGAKAWGLHWFRPWIKSPSSGWLLGLAAGLGFGMLEGAFNLDSTNNWIAGGWVRLAALLLHGLTTSLTGLGYARYIQSNQRRELWRGYTRAVIMHGSWNAAVIGASVIVGVAVLTNNFTLACLGVLMLPVALVYLVLLIRRVSRAGVQTSIQEDFQQAGAPLPIGWRPMKFNFGWRFVGNRPAYATSEVSEPPISNMPQP